jgi:hypothetical protein
MIPQSRRAKSPLYAIGQVFGFDTSSPRNGSNPSTPRKPLTVSELKKHVNRASAAADTSSSSGRFLGATELRTSGKGAPGSAGAGSVVSDSNRSARSDSVKSTKSLASQGGEKSTQEAFERVLGTSGLEVTVYLTSRDGQTKSKRAAIKRDRNSSTVYIELKQRSSRGGVGGLGSAEKDMVKKLKFDLAVDVMMVAKGKGSGRGPHDAKVPRSVDDNSVLHFVLKGKPELNVEVDGGLDSRDAVLMGFMQLISRHRSMNSSNSSGKNGAAMASTSTTTATPASTAGAGSGSMSITGFFS